MKLNLKLKIMTGILSFVMAFVVCTPAVFAGKNAQLRRASKDGNLDEVKRLVAAGANVNDKDKEGNTSLERASNLEVLSYLLDNGASADYKNEKLCWWAHANWGPKSLEMVQFYINHGADVNCKGKKGKYSFDTENRTPLQVAIERATYNGKYSLEIAKLLIKCGANLSYKDWSGSWSILPKAVEYGLAKWMVEEGGVSANYVDVYGRTLLIHAVDQWHIVRPFTLGSHASEGNAIAVNPKPLELAKWLIEQGGADISYINTNVELYNRYNSVFTAFRHQFSTTTSYLPNNGIDAKIEFLKWLVERDVNTRDKFGNTPLSIVIEKCDSAEWCNTDLVSWILSKGVDVNYLVHWPIRNFSFTPLIDAVCREKLEIVRLLLEHGADVNLARDDTGDTPLHTAARIGNIEIGKLLIEHLKLEHRREEVKDYVNRRNKAGETPIIVAKKNGHYDFAQMLIEHGATDEEPSSCLVM